jgi:molybdopterin synthase catalytic subunit
MDRISVQQADFDLAEEYARLSNNPESGAIVSFVGKVRNFNQNSGVTGLHLEHYPAMTQNSLQKLVAAAHEHWPIQACTVIHRVGDLTINDQIVLILVASAHRKAAFAACEFLIDELKTNAPFWKKERLTDGSLRWVAPS